MKHGTTLIQLRGVSKTFGSGAEAVRAVDHVSLELAAGESVAIVGPSGSGKSTLLSMMGLLLPPDSGTVLVGGRNVGAWSDAELCRFRNRNFGYVFQDFALLGDETVLENVRLPLLYRGDVARREHRARVKAAAERLGIEDKLRTRASKLSGGQQQRVALARALVCDQPIVLADEPTGQLDADNRENVVRVLLGLAAEGRLVVVVTHDLDVAARCDRVVRMHDGRLVG